MPDGLAGDLRRVAAAPYRSELDHRIRGLLLAFQIGIDVHHSIAGLITFNAVFNDVSDSVARISAGFFRVSGIVLERRGIKAQRQLAACNLGNDVLSAASSFRVSGKKHFGAGAIDVVLIYAYAKRNRSVVSAAVRVAEGQRCAGNRAQAQIVGRIELKRGNVTLATLKLIREYRTNIGLTVLLGHCHNGALDALRLIDSQHAVGIALERAFDAGAVGVDHVGLGLGIKLENVELIRKRLRLHGNARGFSGPCVGSGDGNAVRFLLADEQEVGRRTVGGVAVVVKA